MSSRVLGTVGARAGGAAAESPATVLVAVGVPPETGVPIVTVICRGMMNVASVEDIGSPDDSGFSECEAVAVIVVSIRVDASVACARRLATTGPGTA